MFSEANYLDSAHQMAPATRDFFRWLTLLACTPVVFYSGMPILSGMRRELGRSFTLVKIGWAGLTLSLVLAAGFYVIFFAGLTWKLIVPVLLAGAVGIVALIVFEPTICQEGVNWPLLKDYQQHRVCTLLDPTKDPLGKGFHIIQGMIAIGSGGLTGKGFMQGTQTHLEFIPERTTDFIFAAFSEEFGLAGTLGLLAAFSFLILRGLFIAADAPTLFARLLAGSITLSIFSYVFVNMGMVSGILPVVGIPLPFISYGGTAMVTLGLALGILMSIARSRRLMQS